MPKPPALEFVTVVHRTSRGVGVRAFDGFSEPNANPEVGTCHGTKDNPYQRSTPAFPAQSSSVQEPSLRSWPLTDVRSVADIAVIYDTHQLRGRLILYGGALLHHTVRTAVAPDAVPPSAHSRFP
jgi:hypothetical protein